MAVAADGPGRRLHYRSARRPVDCARCQPTPASPIVLPAYNEAERIGPALDELFGYLRRRGERGARGRPGAAGLPDRSTSSSWTTAAPTTRPRSSRPGRRPRSAGRTARPAASSACRTAARAPRSGPGCWPRPATSSIFADADMATPPDQLPLLVAALADHDVALGSRIQPDGSDMRASQPRYRRALGRAFHALASVWAAGPVQDTQCGFKGFTRDGRARPVRRASGSRSIVFDVELIYLARRRGYRHGDRPGPLERPARVADAAAARAGAAGRLGPLPDPAPPPRRPSRPARPDARRLIVALARGGAADRRDRRLRPRDRRRILATAGETLGLRLPGVRPGGPAPARRPAALRPDRRSGGRVRDLPLPAAVRGRALVPFALLGDPAGLVAWTALLIACVVGGIALMPVSVPLRWLMLLLAGLDWPVALLDQARPGRADPAAAVRARLALAGGAGPAGGHDRARAR